MEKQRFTYFFDHGPVRFHKVGILYIDNNKVPIEYEDIRKIHSSIFNSCNSAFEYSYTKDGYIYFSKLTIPKDKRICLFSNIYCEKEQKVVLLSKSNAAFSLYHNTDFAFFNSGELQVNIVKFQHGDNLLCFFFNTPNQNTCFSLRADIGSDASEGQLFSLLNKNYKTETNLIKVIDSGGGCSNEYKFMLIPSNTADIDIMQKVKVMVKTDVEEILDEFECGFYERITYPIAQYKEIQPPFVLIYFNFLFKTKLVSERVRIFVDDIKTYVFNAKNELEAILRTYPLTDLDKANLDGNLDIIELMESQNNYSPYISIFCDGIYSISHTLKQGKHIDDFWKQGGYNNLFYYSKLDNSAQICHAYIPENYTDAKKYPLFIGLGTDCCYYSLLFEFFRCVPAICLDASLKGVTLGSYAGEASILETIEFIKTIFHVDDRKIYLFGYSNGGFSAWALSENFPHVFAGILSMGGIPFSPCLNNISNLRILNVSSESDTAYEYGFQKPSAVLNTFEKYTGVLMRDMNHDEISIMMYNFNFYMDLFQYSADTYPSKVQFKTYRNRHRKAYWIEIHAIAYGELSADFTAEIVNEHEIDILIENASGFTITIPPQINKHGFVVRINKTEAFVFTDYKKSQIHFICTENGYLVSDQKPESTKSKKGTGLLDIYLGGLSIVLMNSEVMDIAKVIAQPCTNGYKQPVNVHYPILTEDKLDAEAIKKNLVFIHVNKPDEVPKPSSVFGKIKKQMLIATDAKGFEYQGNRYDGHYVIMQIIDNPFHAGNSVLFVESNDVQVFQKNIFLRRLILPSYLNGIHRYLNNEALITFDEKYFGIYEWGNAMQEIDSRYLQEYDNEG